MRKIKGLIVIVEGIVVAGGLIVHQLPQLFTRLEKGDAFGWDVHPVAGFRIPANAGITASYPETAEASQFHFFTFGQRLGDALKNCVYDNLSLLFGQIDLCRNFFNQLRLGHSNLPLKD
ncbi:hypothetical protein J2S31_000208 [Nitrospina gracilis Nb-211]|nr:hypothetical protein [Nitrospina gracilis Nb-211]